MELKVVFIGNIVPEPSSSAAGKRIVQIMLLFIEFGFEVQYWSENSSNEFSFDCSTASIDLKMIKVNDDSIVNMLLHENPKFILFDRFMTEEKFGWRVASVLPNSIRILDSEDLHFLREFRRKHLLESDSNSFEIVESDTFQREISSMYRCDVTLTISEFEMDFLVSSIGFPIELLHYMPIFAEATNQFQNIFEDRKDFCFVGNFHHQPNVDCVAYLKQEIWPLIKSELPDGKIHIYGAYTNQNIYNLNDIKFGFLVKGRANAVSEVFSRHRVLLAPIRYGAGLKGKLLDAMENGLPSVTSNIGIEGISREEYWNGSVANNPKDFSNAAIKLYKDKLCWIESQINGYKILNSKFNKSLFSEQFLVRLNDLSSNLSDSRRKNFIGAILFRNQNLATKYMSKWIEEKNKKS